MTTGVISSTGGFVGTLNGLLCPAATPAQPVLAFNLAGVDSSTAYRTWGVNAGTNNTNFDCTSTNAWGDTKAINLWTYYSTAPITQPLTIISMNVDVATTVAGPDTATAGSTVQGTYTFANNGTTTANNVTYTMSLSPGLGTVTFGNRPTGTTLTYSNTTGVVTVSGTPLPTTLTAGQRVLGANPAAPMTYSYTAPASGSVTVNTTIATTSTDGVPSNNSASVTTYIGTVDVQTTINVLAIAAPYSTVPGTIQFTNNGTIAATGVTYTATIGNSSYYPALITFTSVPTGVTPSYNNATGVISFTGLPATLGSSQIFTIGFSYIAPSSGLIPVSSAITTTSTDSNPANNNSSDSTFVGPDLTVGKSHTGNFYQGQLGAQYTITVSNTGTTPTAGTITVTDTLPAGLTYVSGAGTGWSCGAVGQVMTCTSSAAIAEGGAGNLITLTVNVAAGAGSPLVNNVSVGGGGETNVGNNTDTDSTIVTTGPDLTVAKSHTGNFYRGQQDAEYTIIVSNIGLADTFGTITVTDTLPTGLTYVSGTGTGWSCGAAGQVVTCTSSAVIAASGASNPITLTVDVAGNAGSPLVNNVSVSGGGETNVGNNTDTDSTVVSTTASDLIVTKTHTGNFTQGQTNAQYTITPRNIGTANATANITIVDTLPAGLTYVSGTGTGWTGNCTPAGQTVTCTTTSNINAGANGNVLTLTVNVSTSAATPLVNTAVISGGNQTNTSNDTTTDSTIVIQLPDLTVAKSHTGNFYRSQTGAQYTITVSNAGALPTTGTITVTDTLPAGLTYVSGTGTGWSCGAVGQVMTCTSSTVIAAGGAGNPITLTVNVAAGAGSPLVNNVSVSGGGESNVSNNTDTDSTIVTTAPDLTVAKSHTGNFYQGQTGAQYTITPNNIGGYATTATITITDTLPTGLTYVSGAGTGWSCGAVGQVMTCTSSAVIAAGGAGNPITLTVNVAGNAGTPLVNNVSISGGGETNVANNTATDSTIVSTTAPDLTVTKTHVGNFTQGQNGAQYTITPRNSGTAAATANITVTDTLPAGLTYVSGTGTGWACNAAGQVVTCTTSSDIAAGANGNVITLTVNVAAGAGSPLVNNVSISGGGETNTSNNTATDSTIVLMRQDLTVAKSHTGNFYQGQNGAQYTITPSNIGQVNTAGTITVTDTLPAGLTYVSGTGTGWACGAAGQVVTCTSSTVIAAGGAGNAITLTVNVAGSAGSPLVNNVSVSGGGETNVSNNTATDSTIVTTGPDLTVAKTHDSAFYLGQTDAQYTITASNIGGFATTGTITVTDTLPTGLTYVSGTGTGWSCGAAGQVMTCTSGTAIAAGGSGNSITLTVNVLMSAPYSVTNNAIVSLAGQSESNTNNNIGVDVTTIMPTLVTLIDFKAHNDNGQVVVEWETASEHNTLGFYLVRLDAATGEYRSITDGLLPSLITNTKGGSYSLIDRGAFPGETHRYILVEVERDGKKIVYGPFSVSTSHVADSQSVRTNSVRASGTGSGARVSDYSRKARQQSAFKKSLIQMRSVSETTAVKQRQMQTSPVKGNRIKIPVSENGLYYMDANDISDITGINYSVIKHWISTRNLSMSNQGRPVAYLPADNNVGLFFYGTGTDSVYTRNNIYWIDMGKGLTMNNETGPVPAPPAPGDAFSDSLYIEKDVFPNMSQTTNPAEDYWDWDMIYLSPYYSDGPKSFTFLLNGKADSQNEASLQVHLVGGSDSGIANDHHVVIKLNGQQIGKEEGELWGGLNSYTFTAVFSQSLLKEGENTIEVQGLLDEGIPFSMFLIDSFDLSYERFYEADGNKLFFKGDGNQSVSVKGFTSTTPDILLFNITNPETPSLNTSAIIDGSTGDYGISFKPVSPEARYLAVAGEAVVKVVNAQAANRSSLRSASNKADYLIIAPDELVSAVEPLSDYRSLKGMKSKVVTVDDIMNEFNFGLSSPEAIKQFLTYAYQYWSREPKYVLLAGGGTWDYRDNKGEGGNLIPPAMVPTSYGLFASDNYLADINGDHVPEIAIGRLPVLTPQEMQDVIAKIKAFEAASSRRVILVADNPDAGGDFPVDSESIAGLFPSSYTLEKVYLGEYPSTELARMTLFNYINAGSVFFNYIGHASFDMFAAEGLITSDDIATLANGTGLPIVTAMTCTAGEFAIPGYPSISQLMVLQNGGGAVAFWSATGLSDNEKAKILNWEFYNAVFNSNKKVLGDAVLQAFGKYKTSGSMPFMMDIYTILGDPALKLR
jgi:uncharacterized repeat protein (TIGR01451 family)